MDHLLAQVSANPDPGGLPGTEQGQQLVDGLMFWGLLGAVAAMVIGALVWALASRGQNPHYAQAGKNGALVAFVAAIIIGAAAALVNWAFDLGGQVSGGKGANATAVALVSESSDQA